MKMSFLPGDLHLTSDSNGNYVVTIAGSEVLRGRSEKKAVSRFKQLRKEMESKYPARELTREERQEMLRQAVGDSLVGHNSLGGRKKKTTAGGTRTFGG
ncbi:MAG TPA: hypothetical protein VFR24_25305 [Candidatus Angelobacter sp.]|nr:hypothetical protein [Candidatus Angelobacter sp.]